MQYPLIFSLVRMATGAYAGFFFLQMWLSPPPKGLEFLALGIPFFPHPSGAAFFLFALASSLALAAGFFRRLGALGVWLCLVGVFNSNSLIREVQFDYLGWLLFFFLLVPSGESFSVLPKPQAHWRLPRPFYGAILACFSLSYSLSGWSKLLTPAWNSGEMALGFFQLGFADGLWGKWASTLPLSALKIVSAGIAIGECLAFPFFLLKKTRCVLWILLTLGQLGLLLFSHLSHISLFMLVFHLAVFDMEWLRKDGKA